MTAYFFRVCVCVSVCSVCERCQENGGWQMCHHAQVNWRFWWRVNDTLVWRNVDVVRVYYLMRQWGIQRVVRSVPELLATCGQQSRAVSPSFCPPTSICSPLPPRTIITTIFPVFESEPQRGVTPRFRHASMNTGCSCNKGSEDEMHVPCLQQHASRLLPRYCFTDTNFISYLSVNEVCNAFHLSVTEGKVCNTCHLFVTEMCL